MQRSSPPTADAAESRRGALRSGVQIGMPDYAERVMRQIVEIFSTGDLDRVRSVISERYIDHQGLRGSDIIRGPEGFSRVVETVRAYLGDLHVSIEDMVFEGDKVAVRLRWRGTHESGTRVDRETIDMLRIAGGRAVEHWGAQSWVSDSEP